MENRPRIAWMVACSALPILWSICSPPVLRVTNEISLSWQNLRSGLRRRRPWTVRGSWKT